MLSRFHNLNENLFDLAKQRQNCSKSLTCFKENLIATLIHILTKSSCSYIKQKLERFRRAKRKAVSYVADVAGMN